MRTKWLDRGDQVVWYGTFFVLGVPHMVCSAVQTGIESTYTRVWDWWEAQRRRWLP
jgi:hypothetical protein